MNTCFTFPEIVIGKYHPEEYDHRPKRSFEEMKYLCYYTQDLSYFYLFPLSMLRVVSRQHNA